MIPLVMRPCGQRLSGDVIDVNAGVGVRAVELPGREVAVFRPRGFQPICRVDREGDFCSVQRWHGIKRHAGTLGVHTVVDDLLGAVSVPQDQLPRRVEAIELTGDFGQ